MRLDQTDLDFILTQLLLPGNQPANILDSTGIRDVQGIGNNVLNPTWGAADQLFPRLLTQRYIQDANGVYYSTPNTPTDTNGNGVIDRTEVVMLTDASPRVISNLIANETTPHLNTPVMTMVTPVNPLPYSSWMTLFGQFFDHGLDFVQKGNPGLIAIPLLPGDPLFNPAFPSGVGTNVMYVSRANVAVHQPGADGVLGTADDIRESTNTISPFIDLSQSYGSLPGHTVFLREYDENGQPTGKLVSGPNGGMARWVDIQANALRIGITLHDIDVLDIPQVALNADGTYLSVNGQAVLVSLVDGVTTFVQDSAAPGVQRIGHAFLDDIAHSAGSALASPTGVDAQGDLVNPALAALLDAHYVAGDGRTNENIGLTAVHDVFHAEHNRLVDQIRLMLLERPGVIDGTEVWTGEMIFQAAKLASEMQYQHLVFDEFARRISPNIGEFAGYDISINPAITAEFAHAIYRFGHSMLTETVDRIDPVTGASNPISLIQAFLNPVEFAAMGDNATGALAIGMSRQVGSEIDEYVTDALRNNLVGLPLDLAAINIARGRDTGMPTLNEARRQLFALTNEEASLRPYDSWDDFGNNLLHPESLKNFVMAYSRDAILTQFGRDAQGNPQADIAYWNALQTSDPAAYAAALQAAGTAAINDVNFMFTDQGFERIDLWIGGLAEQKVDMGMLGSTFDFIFAYQMSVLQDADRFYYLERLTGTNMLIEIESQKFADIVMRNSTATHLYADIFSVADSYVQMSDPATWKDGAGFFNGTFYGARGDYTDARGVINPNGRGNASEVIAGTAAGDRINGMGGNDTIYGDGGNDTIDGGRGNDFLRGGDGDDVITDLEGDDFIWGGAGNDRLNGGVGLDAIFGGDGDDLIRGGRNADQLEGGAGNDTIYGDDDADVIDGQDGNDILYGGAGADKLDGGAGDDILIGGTGFDEMRGGLGNDLFLMDATDIGFNNLMIGEEGFDTVSYAASLAGVTADLSNLGVIAIAPGANQPDAYAGIEGLIGSAFNDVLIGDLFDNVIEGGLGNDQMAGGLGNDTLSFASSTVSITANLGTGVSTGAGNDSFNGFENLRGGSANDTLIGNGDANRLEGRGGNDTLLGRGDAGDVAVYSGTRLDYSVVFTGGSSFTVTDLRPGSPDGTDTVGEIEFFQFSDVLLSAAQVLLPVATITSNTASQPEGNDGGTTTFSFTVSLSTAPTSTQTLNWVVSGTGISPASAEDFVGGVLPSGVLTFASGQTTATIDIPVLAETLLELDERFTVTLSNPTAGLLLIGTSSATATIVADDQVSASLALEQPAPAVEGTAASPTVYRFTVTLDAAYDTTQTVNYAVTGVGPNAAQASDFVGGTLPGGTVTFLAGETVKTIEILVAADAGLELDESFQLTLSNPSAGIRLATQTAVATIVNDDQDLFGTAGNDTLIGNAQVNNLYGAAGDDTLDGAEGDDGLFGEAGNDTLIGGAGNDTMQGGTGNDTYQVDDAGDVVIELANEGTDEVRTALSAYTLGDNVENLRYTGSAAFSGTGNALDNRITGGAANDTLFGNAGNDTLDGGAGADSMTGGTGDDTYVVDSAGDVVTEAASAGTDTVQTTLAAYTLGANLENLQFTGAGGFTGIGNELGNRITGGIGNDILRGLAGDDTLVGGDGADVLVGGAGTDQLTGGAGNDVFAFESTGDSSGTNSSLRDVINDFVKGQDRIDLSGIDANTGSGGDQAFTWRGTGSFSGAAQIRMVVSGTNTLILANVNSNATAEFSILLIGNYTTGANALTASDFIL